MRAFASMRPMVLDTGPQGLGEQVDEAALETLAAEIWRLDSRILLSLVCGCALGLGGFPTICIHCLSACCTLQLDQVSVLIHVCFRESPVSLLSVPSLVVVRVAPGQWCAHRDLEVVQG